MKPLPGEICVGCGKSGAEYYAAKHMPQCFACYMRTLDGLHRLVTAIEVQAKKENGHG